MRQKDSSPAAHAKLLLFDLDGTLADSFSLFVEVFREAATRFCFDRFDQDKLDFVRMLRADEVLSFHRVSPASVLEVLAFIRAEMESRAAEVEPFAGVYDTLSTLYRQGHTLVLLTSNSLALAACSLGSTIMELWTCVSTEIPLREKAVEMLRLTSRYPSLPSLAVGDEIRDFEAAQKAGVRFIGVPWGYNSVPALRRAGHTGHILGSFQELVTLTNDVAEESLV